MITSETSFGSTLARRSASMIATSPSLCAGRLASPPLKAPTGVRAALAITISVIKESPCWVDTYRDKSSQHVGLGPRGIQPAPLMVHRLEIAVELCRRSTIGHEQQICGQISP